MTKRLLLGKNNSSDMLGGKTTGETRTGTGGERDREDKTDKKQNRAGGPKTGSGMVLSKRDVWQVTKTCCSSLAMDWISASCSGLGFSSYKLPTRCWRAEW